MVPDSGVSRITIYRKFATKDALAEEVIAREFRRYFERFVVEIVAADTVADRVVFAFVSSLRAIAGNELIGGLLEAEPEQLVGSTEATGRTLAAVRIFVAGQLRREQQAGNVSPELDADLTAEMMVRISSSFLTVPSGIVDLDDDAQLAAIARRYLVPMLDAPS